VEDIFESLPADAREALSEKGPPHSPAPMLATLTDRRFSDANWIYERKLDGERCIAVREGGDVRLVSRNGKELNDAYPELEEALSRQECDTFAADGEIVAFSGNVTSFERLQHRMQIKSRDEARASDVKVYYYLFDLLHLAGYDTTGLALRHRKGLLRRALDFSDPIRYTRHRNEEGESFYKEACRKGWEGVIAKRADSTYAHSRSTNWLKFKCVNQQEFVIGGYTDPQGERIGFGALLIGYYENDDLIYAGKVGTGYDDETLESLSSRLASLERKTAPFDEDRLPTKGVHWVTPKLVAQISFTEWTEGGKLRHPSFMGLRRGKNPEEVVRERPRA
jgi:bifunctional non-homologous end joining protein LigD